MCMCASIFILSQISFFIVVVFVVLVLVVVVVIIGKKSELWKLRASKSECLNHQQPDAKPFRLKTNK